jgi:hypothetical protein
MLLALEDIHDMDLVGRLHFLERHADLTAIGGIVGVQLDRHAGLLVHVDGGGADAALAKA